MGYTNQDIRAKYEGYAARFDRVEAPLLWTLGVPRLRRRLLRRAAGRVLEVAAGTGFNFPHYPAGVRLTASDLSGAMLSVARRRAARLALAVELAETNAESLGFAEHSFDTVVSTLSLCTFPDPIRALRELMRVCRPGGKILLLEHGRSSIEFVARWQDRMAEPHAKRLGCQWNRNPLELVSAAGVGRIESRRHLFGVFYSIEAIAT
jgi:ubiquinone/menaquinone biosynthesis C-methylase UbiE